MTRAPDNLLAVRRLLLDHLDLDPTRSRPADLDPVEAGIVGDAAHRGGYHCGRDRVVSGDYSVLESPRDRNGLSDYASALDIGEWSVSVNGKRHDLRSMSIWLVAQCKAGAVDTLDIREVIYSPDGAVVRRWDRLGRRSTGDSSHLTHTHVSYFRDATKAGRDLTPLYRRYLTTIGLIKQASEEDKVTEAEIIAATRKGVHGLLKEAAAAAGLETAGEPTATGRQVRDYLGAVLVHTLAGQDLVDEPGIVSGVLATLTPAAIASAIPPGIAGQVVDELRDRLVDAEQVRGGQGQAGG